MKKSALLLFVLGFVLNLSAQQCSIYFPENEGTQLTYKNFDDKGKLSGTQTQKLTKINSIVNGVLLEIATEYFDKNGKEIHKGTLEVKCENNTYYIDMEKYLDKNTMAGFEGMDIQIESSDMEIPSAMKPGDVLKDAWVKATISNSGMKVMTMMISITNRKVEAEESLTTEAGTFKCLKITQTIETKTVMKVVMKSAEWYSPKVGMVKSESFSTSDKLYGSTVLTAISK